MGLSVAALMGCTPPLPDTTVDELDQLGTAAVGLIGTPELVQTVALSQAAENENLCKYLSGQPYQLGAPDPVPAVSALAREQGAAGRELQTYMESLIEATRGASVAQLEGAVSDLSGSFAELARASGTLTDASSALDVAVDYTGRVGESERQTRIRAIMFGATDTLLNLEALLRRDATQVIGESTTAVQRWERASKCVLRQTRARAGAIAIFDQYDATGAGLARQLNAIQKAPDTVDLLIQAHLEATDPDLTFEEGLRGFVDILKEDDDLRETLKDVAGDLFGDDSPLNAPPVSRSATPALAIKAPPSPDRSARP